MSIDTDGAEFFTYKAPEKVRQNQEELPPKARQERSFTRAEVCAVLEGLRAAGGNLDLAITAFSRDW